MTKKQALVVEKYVAEFKKMQGLTDNERVHGNADDLLLDALRELGFGQLADAWDELQEDVGGFWYA